MYLGFIWPFRSAFLCWTELFNELAALFLCYFMFCFTDWIPGADTRYMIGWLFITIITLHLASHLMVLVRSSFIELKTKAKDKYGKKKQGEPMTPDEKQSKLQSIMRKRMLEKIDKNTKAEDLSGWRKYGRKEATNWKA